MNRFIRKEILAMVILTWVCSGFISVIAQKTITMYLLDRGWSGDTNTIELRGTQFQNISSLNFSIREIGNKGTPISVEQISLPNFSAPNIFMTPGSIRFNWTSPFINGFNSPDGHSIFLMKWISNPAMSHCYEITNNADVTTVINSIYSSANLETHTSCEILMVMPSFFNAFRDMNNNCSYETQESLFKNYTIQDSFNQKILIYNNPQFLVYEKSDFGRHYYKLIPENSLWTSCNQEQILNIDSTTKFISLNYGIKPLIPCSQLEVEIHAPVVRRCIDYKYYISYANKGTIAADSTKIRIKLDPYMSLKAASIPVSSLQLPYVEFDLGFLDVFQGGEFNITVNIDCNSSVIGQAHCVTAQILPKNDCIISPLWSGASINLNSTCASGKAIFRIENAGSEHMLEPVKYWIVEDDIMPGLKKDIKLNSGQFLDIEYPANGKSYRLLVDQVKNHPGHSHPTVTLEACGRDSIGNFSTGYLLQFAEDEENPDVSIDCQASRGSFDPNDKTGLPLGYGVNQFIEPQRSIEYKIRFQNTGNDTAFKIIIVDTLSEWVDLKTLDVLGASHEFSYRLVDRILSFHFDPIYLPYQSIDEEGSNGYLRYSIQSKKDAPLKSKIYNDADIYFDFNPPIKTNTTLHTLATDFIIVSVSSADPDNTLVNIYPNPGTDFLIIDSERMTMEKDLTIYDAYGRKAISQKLNGRNCKVSLKDLTPGVYFLYLKDFQNQTFSRKIVLNTKNK